MCIVWVSKSNRGRWWGPLLFPVVYSVTCIGSHAEELGQPCWAVYGLKRRWLRVDIWSPFAFSQQDCAYERVCVCVCERRSDNLEYFHQPIHQITCRVPIQCTQLICSITVSIQWSYNAISSCSCPSRLHILNFKDNANCCEMTGVLMDHVHALWKCLLISAGLLKRSLATWSCFLVLGCRWSHYTCRWPGAVSYTGRRGMWSWRAIYLGCRAPRGDGNEFVACGNTVYWGSLNN